MMYLLYTLAFLLGLIVSSPYYIYRALKQKKYLSNLGQRLGVTGQIRPARQPTIWIHAVSVGETLAVQPLVHRLQEQFPGQRLVFSTTTTTGQAIARARLADVAEIIFFPLDLAFSVRRHLETVAPSLVLIVETEIWPNFLRACHRRGIPVILVNGRISDGSFKGYRIFRRALPPVLNHFNLLLMQSRRDAERILELGARPERVMVTGNLKYDLKIPDLSHKLATLDHMLNLTAGRLFVAGSTARGEESLLLEAFVQLIEQPEFQDLRLLLAPRRPERFDEVEELIRRAGLACVRRSRAEGSRSHRSSPVILLDTMGELAAVYSLADVVFVGGSLVPVGGHNILEPALFGKPILVGPHTSNFQAMVDEFVQERALIQLKPATGRSLQHQLTNTLRSLFEDSARRKALGEQTGRLMERNRGATEQTLDLIGQLHRRRQQPSPQD